MKSKMAIQLIFFSIIASIGLNAHTRTLEEVVAIVNDEMILKSDVEEFKKKLKAGTLTDDLIIPNDTERKKALGSDKVLLDTLIQSKIIDSEIKRLDLQVTIERIEAEIRSIAKRNGINRSQLITALKDQGMPFSEYQDFIRKSLERRSLVEREINSKIKISDEDVAAFYLKNNKDASNKIFEYTLSHIFISANKRGNKAAKSRGQEVYQKLKKGESFDDLASDYSEDPNYTSGGFLGNFKAGEMFKTFEKAVEKLQMGEFSKVVKGPAGFHILKVTNKKLIPDPKLASIKNKIRNQLFAEAFKTQFVYWIEEKKSESFIRIN